MQRIEIENFGAIKSAKIDIKKVLILIGEQASGKSTIAKLIYFFKSLGDDWFNRIYQGKGETFNIVEELIFPVNEKFYDFFGSTFHLPNFKIIFFYNVEQKKSIELSLNSDKSLKVKLSSALISYSFKSKISDIRKQINQHSNDFIARTKVEQLNFEQNRINNIQSLVNLINETFCIIEDESLFLVAGRSATVGYTDLFEKYLFADIQNRIRTNANVVLKSKERTVDESLMLRFMERVSKMRDRFEYSGGFEGIAKSEEKNDRISKAYQLIQTILKGKYVKESQDEKLYFEEGNYIYLRNTSSGQQEVIRLLQDLFLIIQDKQKVLRIIEEPEAHLFPIAQKQLIELMALMVNQSSDNQLIITTHSPYVLTSFNNLLYAHKTAERYADSVQEVTQVILQDFWLDTKAFSAYAIGNTFDTQASYCEDIYDEKTGLIQQNYLDTVSEILGMEFQKLYRINAKSLSKK